MDLHGKKILLIEDDDHIYSLVEAMLKSYDIDLIFKQDGQSGLKAALEKDLDLILLDIMLPEKDGWEICRELKNKGVETPIIMLTAKVEETDKVLGLEIGADDYVTKPFSPRELTARIKAVIRRFEKTKDKPAAEKKALELPSLDLRIDPKSRAVYIQGSEIAVAPKEFQLLVFLARRPNQAFSREELLTEIWGPDTDKRSRTIDEHIKRLRKKLSKGGLEEIPLETVWGVGYKFVIKDELENET
ncbi:response regulator [Halanaerobacter jeridensis]|uniref:Stage 0 sporulation protein A homolog n=1 Tax=Halanaerobacter jeridensis TaxID=706427 RepID=A0A938XQ79_9FIRM|nr:response regulator transcription factor [Halanaerobacter jeridensis]MBM7557382.1 DNA-binding response OmpR family regulator [Halanaerobacter jeridensis]